MCLQIMNIYMYKKDLALNNLQLMICHKIQPNVSIAGSSLILSNHPTQLSIAQCWSANTGMSMCRSP